MNKYKGGLYLAKGKERNAQRGVRRVDGPVWDTRRSTNSLWIMVYDGKVTEGFPARNLPQPPVCVRLFAVSNGDIGRSEEPDTSRHPMTNCDEREQQRSLV
jgi:hypothetical protein